MLARARSERGHAAWTLRLLGEIALHHDCPDVATAEGMTFCLPQAEAALARVEGR
jgi:hypothetical protein